MTSTNEELLDGKAFELSVASEVLHRGFNCSMPVVDAGIDLLAWKKNAKPLKVQVKGRKFLWTRHNGRELPIPQIFTR